MRTSTLGWGPEEGQAPARSCSKLHSPQHRLEALSTPSQPTPPAALHIPPQVFFAREPRRVLPKALAALPAALLTALLWAKPVTAMMVWAYAQRWYTDK
jgi:hypothetical protein